MRRLIRIQTRALMEVLGSGEQRETDPRRNTSKSFFEALRSRNKATTCCGFVVALHGLLATLLQLCCSFGSSSGNKAATSNDLTLDKSAGYYGS